MTKKRLAKGEGQKIVLKAIENRWKGRIEIRDETGLEYTTIDEALKALHPNKVEKSVIYNSKGSKIIKYRSKIAKKEIDPKYLKLIIENYNSGIPEKKEIAWKEIVALGLDKESDMRIFDKNFIDFVIKNLAVSYKKKNGFDFPYPFEEIFDTIVLKLRKDITLYPENSERQIELLDYIQKKLKDIFEDVIVDTSDDYFKKRCALSNLVSMNCPAYDVVFRFLKTMKCPKNIDEQHFSDLFNEIVEIVKLYADKDIADCQMRLWDAYDNQKDKKAKKKILFLLDITKLGYKNSRLEQTEKLQQRHYATYSKDKS